MRYRISHSTHFSYGEAVPVCHNEVRLTPRQTPWQTCERFAMTVRPEPNDAGRRLDYFGNGVEYFSIQEAHSRLSVTVISQVTVRERPTPNPPESPAWEKVVAKVRKQRQPEPLFAFQFTFKSAHVVWSPDILDYTRPSFPPNRPVLEGAMDLTQRIHEDFKYDPRATNVMTPVSEVLEMRRGVCQDFAHVQIACLRAIGIPARYVSGYLRTLPPPGKPRLVGADASHAWLSVYCGDLGWIDLDPTNNAIPSVDHITLAYGCDYADVCPIKGVFVGGGQHAMTVSVDVAPAEEPTLKPAT